MQTHTPSALETLIGNMTIGGLAEKSQISVEALVQRAFAPLVQRRPAPPAETHRPTRHQATPAAQYLPLQDAVLSVLREEKRPIRGDMLRGKVAALHGHPVSAGELRTAVNTAVRGGAKIVTKGKTRGTTYLMPV